MADLSGDPWVVKYATSHTNRVNKLLHMFGIPMIALSVALLVLSLFWGGLFWPALVLFVLGWVLQFVGHAIEGKPPEFLSDWRFLFVGLRWWSVKMRDLLAGRG